MDIDYNTLTDLAGLDGHQPLFWQGTEPLIDLYLPYCGCFYTIGTHKLYNITPGPSNEHERKTHRR